MTTHAIKSRLRAGRSCFEGGWAAAACWGTRLWGNAILYALAMMLAFCPVLAAEEISEAEAIAELKSLGGRVYEYAAPSFDPRRKSKVLKAADVGARNSDRLIALLKHIRGLQAVSIEGCSVTDAGIAALKLQPRLRILTLRHSEPPMITDAGLREIGAITTLTSLSLGRTPVSKVGFAQLANLAELETFDASGPAVTDGALAELARLANLKRLSLSETALTNAGLAVLKRIGRLNFLRLHSKSITDGAIAQLKGLNLLELHIGDAISDGGLKDLKDFKLISLSLADLPITDTGLKELSLLTTLRELDLRGTRISDAGLRELRPLTTIDLPLGKSAKSDAGPLPRIRGLVDLHLEDTAISDAGLREFSTFEHVPDLYLAGTKVTEDGMDELRRAKKVGILSWPGAPPPKGASSGGRQPRTPIREQ